MQKFRVILAVIPQSENPKVVVAKDSFRDSAIQILELLSSLKAQNDYKKNVPLADVPTELVCMWFDDFWHPDDTLKKHFQPHELSALTAFHHFFEARVDYLPSSTEGLEALHSSSKWSEIVDKAAQTLKTLLPDGQ